MSEIVVPTNLSSMIKEIYAPMVKFQHPELVEKYGIDAVWDALGKAGPVCGDCGCDGCHFDCGCVCS